MQFCADLSHWALVQVLDDFNKQATLWKYPKPDMFHPWGPILDRTSVIQCRISDGDSVQVDVGDGTSELAQQWIELWAEIMRRWPASKTPAPYSIHDPEGRELSDRWEQALVMKKPTELAWQKVQKSQT